MEKKKKRKCPNRPENFSCHVTYQSGNGDKHFSCADWKENEEEKETTNKIVCYCWNKDYHSATKEN